MPLIACRVLVVGPTGSGKSTLARELASRSGILCVELDELRLEAGWKTVPDAQFRADVTSLVARPEWIISGNYAGVRDITWGHAQLVVWLDFSLPLVLRRLIPRTLRRLVSREEVGPGYRETWRRVLSRHSIVYWAVRSHAPLRAEYERAMAVYGKRVAVVRLRSAREEREWLAATVADPTVASPATRGLVIPDGRL